MFTESATTLKAPIDRPEIAGRTWSIKESYRYCRSIALSHYENFPVASILLPSTLRSHFYSIYAFARIADDFADEAQVAGGPDARLALLARWREMLVDCYGGTATHPVFVALGETASKFALPLALFEDLISAFSQDVTKKRYETFAELLDYCRRSANPIGRLVLLLFGYKGQQLCLLSDSVCTGLQLTNHWQDLAIDLARDRVYLPIEDIARFGLAVEELKNPMRRDRVCRLLAFEVARTRSFFDDGERICDAVAGRLALELRAVWLGGVTILDRIERSGYDVFSQRPRITTLDKLRIASLAIARKAAGRADRRGRDAGNDG